MKKITEFTPDMVGKRIKCKIEGGQIDDARIQYEGDTFYICQNKRDGTGCRDRLGFKWSWTVKSGSASDITHDHVRVSEIFLLDEYESIPIKSTEPTESKIPIQLINISKKSFLKINQND